MSHMYFPVEVLERFCGDAFRKFGFPENESRIITEVLLALDQFGILEWISKCFLIILLCHRFSDDSVLLCAD